MQQPHEECALRLAAGEERRSDHRGAKTSASAGDIGRIRGARRISVAKAVISCTLLVNCLARKMSVSGTVVQGNGNVRRERADLLRSTRRCSISCRGEKAKL